MPKLSDLLKKKATEILYNNSSSGLTAEEVQSAIDEMKSLIDGNSIPPTEIAISPLSQSIGVGSGIITPLTLNNANNSVIVPKDGNYRIDCQVRIEIPKVNGPETPDEITAEKLCKTLDGQLEEPEGEYFYGLFSESDVVNIQKSGSNVFSLEVYSDSSYTNNIDTIKNDKNFGYIIPSDGTFYFILRNEGSTSESYCIKNTTETITPTQPGGPGSTPALWLLMGCDTTILVVDGFLDSLESGDFWQDVQGECFIVQFVVEDDEPDIDIDEFETDYTLQGTSCCPTIFGLDNCDGSGSITVAGDANDFLIGDYWSDKLNGTCYTVTETLNPPATIDYYYDNFTALFTKELDDCCEQFFTIKNCNGDEEEVLAGNLDMNVGEFWSSDGGITPEDCWEVINRTGEGPQDWTFDDFVQAGYILLDTDSCCGGTTEIPLKIFELVNCVGGTDKVSATDEQMAIGEFWSSSGGITLEDCWEVVSDDEPGPPGWTFDDFEQAGYINIGSDCCGGTTDIPTTDIGTTDIGTTDIGTTGLGTTEIGTTGLGTTMLPTTDSGIIVFELRDCKNDNFENVRATSDQLEIGQSWWKDDGDCFIVDNENGLPELSSSFEEFSNAFELIEDDCCSLGTTDIGTTNLGIFAFELIGCLGGLQRTVLATAEEMQIGQVWSDNADCLTVSNDTGDSEFPETFEDFILLGFELTEEDCCGLPTTGIGTTDIGTTDSLGTTEIGTTMLPTTEIGTTGLGTTQSPSSTLSPTDGLPTTEMGGILEITNTLRSYFLGNNVGERLFFINGQRGDVIEKNTIAGRTGFGVYLDEGLQNEVFTDFDNQSISYSLPSTRKYYVWVTEEFGGGSSFNIVKNGISSGTGFSKFELVNCNGLSQAIILAPIDEMFVGQFWDDGKGDCWEVKAFTEEESSMEFIDFLDAGFTEAPNCCEEPFLDNNEIGELMTESILEQNDFVSVFATDENASFTPQIYINGILEYEGSTLVLDSENYSGILAMSSLAIDLKEGDEITLHILNENVVGTTQAKTIYGRLTVNKS